MILFSGLREVLFFVPAPAESLLRQHEEFFCFWLILFLVPLIRSGTPAEADRVSAFQKTITEKVMIRMN